MTSSPITPLEADYVIIGGGTSGLVLAARLSECDSNRSVIVLEAGKNLIDDHRVQTPALWTTLMGSEADWQFQSTPQAALNNRVIKETQGRVLGGSSAINGQAFIAPTKAGIDAWDKLGATGWTWENFAPYYKKATTLQLPDEDTRDHIGVSWVDPEVNGNSGPIKVSFPAVKESPLAKAWVDSFQGMGYGCTADPFSGVSTGGYSNLASVDFEKKQRSYAATGYGLPAMERRNVRIITEATVQRILFSTKESGATATGAEARIDGQIVTIKARKEVILTAGALNTPKLLELSGIGNRQILDQYSIPVIVENRNVGENLQDHLMTGISFEVKPGIATGDPLLRQEPEAIKTAFQLYSEQKAGPMTIGGVQSSAYMPLTGYSGQPEARVAYFDSFPPDLNERDQVIRDIYAQEHEPTCQIFMFLAQANLHESGKSFVGQKLLPGNFLSLGLIQTLPFSRGAVHIASADPTVSPIIEPRYFSNPLDMNLMARNLLSLERLHSVKPIADYLVEGGCRNHPDAFLTDLESAKKYLRDTATTSYHLSGTAAMLPQEKGGVVDENLRVYGTTNLRVCDASIFPLMTTANPMSTVYAVAERAADIIKGAQ
ncbi:GMC family oxidoreductase [Aspergillus neoniger CBS 115656]|uniref:Glucose-methanol-choline oxidoreductase n=1 Tax=Aspergillus neoniger (strain CBS 115656) TaxID=1448310 RepID=A0A318Y2U2_ASPNB|nr:glucose-methanol-choline oxidoreductase [Aspergillus neoniger CBS 115656]PYH28646.1 glucose-methanol-choline oxidoreductase [Aspergillus neoniger CBS 115656]